MREEQTNEVTRISKKDFRDIMLLEYGSEYWNYRKQFEELAPPFPIHLDFEIIDSCNFRCSMCVRTLNSAKKLNTGEKLPSSIYKSLIDEGVKKGLKSISFGAGDEPLLHEGLIDFIKYAREKGVIDIRIHTNGSLLTKEISKKLIKNKVTWLSVSLDSTDEETFYKIRGNKQYNRIVENINNFLDIKKKMKSKLPIFRLSFIKMDINKNQKEEFIKRWIDKVDYIAFQDQIIFSDKQKRKTKCFMCIDPFRRLWIRPNGDVYICCCMIHVYSKSNGGLLGNIHDAPLSMLWNSHKLSQIRKNLLRMTPPEICIECQEKRVEGWDRNVR